jgi:UDP-N-acetylglucosamine 2-epimerase
MGIKVMSIFGTRPEAIKMAPLVKALEADNQIQSIVCVTAQHREMLDQVLRIFDIKPDYDLNIMAPQQTLAHITTKAINGIEEVVQVEKPDLILVHGDTSTTFAGALVGFYNKIKVGHVEAGLRTFDKYQPFPEEINRTLTTKVADMHFAPTSLSEDNLLRDGIAKDSIYVVGNTVIDVLATTIDNDYKFVYQPLNEIDFVNKRVITVTAHRRENLGEPLENICFAIKKLVEEFDDIEIVYAVHKNPVVMDTVNKVLNNTSRVHLIDPLDLQDMHNLMNRSYLVLTDSGGIQEEVPSLGKPVLVLRNVTERPEGVQAGTLKLAGTDTLTIYNMAKELLIDKIEYDKIAKAKNPYGDGKTSQRIVKAIKKEFGLSAEEVDRFDN